jgi:hypothetical protein
MGCTFTYYIREGVSGAMLADDMEKMCFVADIDVRCGGTFILDRTKLPIQKQLPYNMTRRFRDHGQFVIGDMVLLQDRPHQQSPVKDKVKVLEFHYDIEPAQLKFECSADTNPFWPLESCTLADLEPMLE